MQKQQWHQTSLQYLSSLEEQLFKPNSNFEFKIKLQSNNKFTLMINQRMKPNPTPTEEKDFNELDYIIDSPRMKESQRLFFHNKEKNIHEIKFPEPSIEISRKNLQFEPYYQENYEPQINQLPLITLNSASEQISKGLTSKNFIKNIMNCFIRFICLNTTQQNISQMIEGVEKNRRVDIDSIRVNNNPKLIRHNRTFENKKIQQFFKEINMYYSNKTKISYNKNTLRACCSNYVFKCSLQYWLTYLSDYCLQKYSLIKEALRYSHRVAAKIMLEHVVNNTCDLLTFKSSSISKYNECQIQKPIQLKELFGLKHNNQISEEKQINKNENNPYNYQEHSEYLDLDKNYDNF